ncbi:MAG: RNA polymerase subunit sigma-24, partial [Spirochaetaceae bacterium]|nr:RNA polymerase subunit sigma-24 [Spirochaetaceae bacterium]
MDFRKIYNATMQVLFRIAFNVVEEREVAEDIVHDAYIKMTEKKSAFTSMDLVKYWLIRVVRNASYNYVKRRNSERRVYEKILYSDPQEGDSEDVLALRKDTK